MVLKDNIFLLRSMLTNTRGGKNDYISCERLLNVRYLRETGQNATVYDKELNLYFHDPSALAQIYEIETVEFNIKASSHLSKAEEYIRRINYRYDWIQIKVNLQGKVLGIQNKEELKERWSRLRTAIRKDYKGDVVELGLSRINKQFDDPKEIEVCISQYFYFGLLFPCIPKYHKENWTHSRKIRFSDYENEIFEENMAYIRTEEENKYYELTGNPFPNSLTTMNYYKGGLRITGNNIFPESADIKIEFERDNIINQWSFNLLRYN